MYDKKNCSSFCSRRITIVQQRDELFYITVEEVDFGRRH